MASNINSCAHVRVHHIKVAHTPFGLFTLRDMGGHGKAIAPQLLTAQEIKGRRIKGWDDIGL